MKILNPININDENLNSSTVPQPDTDKGEIDWVAGTYLLGTRRVDGDLIYEVSADPSTTDQPSVGSAKPIPTWVVVGPVNRLAMFDSVNSTATVADNSIVVVIEPGEIVNGLAGFSVAGATAINVTVLDLVEGEVYNTDIDMIDNSQVDYYYNYFFSPIIRKSQFILLDLPAYPNATITITVTGDAISFGNLVLGQQVDLGIANYGTSLELLDFSRKERNDFGALQVSPGLTSKLVNYDVAIEKSRANYVYGVLSSLGQGSEPRPTVWIGAGDTDDPTVVFGYYRSYTNTISSPGITEATIQVEGLT